MSVRVILLIIVLLILAIILMYWAFFPDCSPYWTGFGAYNENIYGPRSKTLWDWLDLLIIPVAIGIFGYLFTENEKKKERKRESEKNQNDHIDSFMRTLTDLITNHNLANNSATEESKIIARTRVILVLKNINGARKGQVLQFLFESGLIKKNPIIDLNGCDFRDSILDGIVLRGAEIRGAYFSHSTLTNSFLNDVNFAGCEFIGVDFSGSDVKNSNLTYCNLSRSNLKKLDLTTVELEGVNITSASLENSVINKVQLDQIIKKEGMNTNKLEIK